MRYATVAAYTAAIEKTEAQIEEIENQLKLLKAELLTMVGADLSSALAAKGKEYGSVSVEIDGVSLTYEVRQTVSWDQAKLQNLWQSLPLEVGDKLIDLKFSVSEKMYDACIDEAIKAALTDARTTKLSSPSVKPKNTK